MRGAAARPRPRKTTQDYLTCITDSWKYATAMPVEGACGGERILDLSEFSNNPVNGIRTLGIASDTSVSESIPPPLFLCLRSFIMILSVQANRMAEPRKVMWIKIFHLMCSGFSFAMSTNDSKR